jgi:glycerol uptake facilitator-like aquaporin
MVLIFTFGPISGAHFNPAVTLADASQGGISWSDVPAYIVAQVLGSLIGVAAAHLMFGEALIQVSQHVRAGGGQLFSEFVATFGLLCVIWGCARLRSEGVPVAVGLYITGAYWFTASTSFANPAVNAREGLHRYICGDSPLRRTGFYVGAVSRRLRCDCAFSLACTGTPLRSERRCVSACRCQQMNDE